MQMLFRLAFSLLPWCCPLNHSVLVLSAGWSQCSNPLGSSQRRLAPPLPRLLFVACVHRDCQNILPSLISFVLDAICVNTLAASRLLDGGPWSGLLLQA